MRRSLLAALMAATMFLPAAAFAEGDPDHNQERFGRAGRNWAEPDAQRPQNQDRPQFQPRPQVQQPAPQARPQPNFTPPPPPQQQPDRRAFDGPRGPHFPPQETGQRPDNRFDQRGAPPPAPGQTNGGWRDRRGDTGDDATQMPAPGPRPDVRPGIRGVGGTDWRGNPNARGDWRSDHHDGDHHDGGHDDRDRDGDHHDWGHDRHDDHDRFDGQRNYGWNGYGNWNGNSWYSGRNDYRDSDFRRWDNRWHNDNRYDWRRYRAYNRDVYRLPRYYAPYGWDYGYRRFGIGITLNSFLFGQDYWIYEPEYYRLPPAYGPYRWVRYYNDALLVDIRSGYVVDVVYDIFW